jgi:hypothetical protein
MELSGQLHVPAALSSGKKSSLPIGYKAVFLGLFKKRISTTVL